MSQPPGHIAELIFELGRLQVFHYPSLQDIQNNLNPTEVYWQDKVSKHTYGPFPSVYVAMTHYTWIVANQKASESDVLKKNADIIHVNFATRKRIIYDLP